MNLLPPDEEFGPERTQPATPERTAYIDMDMFKANVIMLRELVAPAGVMLAVKANAYGHGMIPMAWAALQSGAESLAVLDIPAGLELRAAGITAPIFAWMHDPDADFRAAADADIDLGISAIWQIEAIAAAGSATAPRVHLKIDTGLSRNGATAADWPDLVRAAMAADTAGSVTLYAAWSHLADASPADDAVALARFHEAVEIANELGARFAKLHIAASSAGLRMPEARLDFVRFGIAAYGISPFDDASGSDLDLGPVMTLSARVSSVKRVPAGQGVSYGYLHRTEQESNLALVPLGYADGIPRFATGKAVVQLNGTLYPIAGRIAMDQFVIDVGDDAVKPGDDVIIFSQGWLGEPTAEDWAGYAGTIGDEIVSRIGHRVVRRYTGVGHDTDTGLWTPGHDC